MLDTSAVSSNVHDDGWANFLYQKRIGPMMKTEKVDTGGQDNKTSKKNLVPICSEHIGRM